MKENTKDAAITDTERLDFLIKHGYAVYQYGNNATYHGLATLGGRDEWCELRCDDPRDVIDFAMQQMWASA